MTDAGVGNGHSWRGYSTQTPTRPLELNCTRTSRYQPCACSMCLCCYILPTTFQLPAPGSSANRLLLLEAELLLPQRSIIVGMSSLAKPPLSPAKLKTIESSAGPDTASLGSVDRKLRTSLRWEISSPGDTGEPGKSKTSSRKSTILDVG